jgi:hypothetical protein
MAPSSYVGNGQRKRVFEAQKAGRAPAVASIQVLGSESGRDPSRGILQASQQDYKASHLLVALGDANW